MVNTITNGTRIVLSKQGDRLQFYPGMVVNNSNRELSFNCGESRAMSYYIEYLILMAIFGKTDLDISITGITNDNIDPSIDQYARVLPHIMSKFCPEANFLLKILQRGFRPNGLGSVSLKVGIVKTVTNCKFTQDSLVKRIRGTCYVSKASVNIVGRIISSAREILNDYIPDVWIYSEYSKGVKASKDPGYGVTLIGETSSGCLLSQDRCLDIFGEKADNGPEELGKNVAILLVEEIMNAGVVDTTLQSFCLFLMAFSGPKPCQIKLGRISAFS